MAQATLIVALAVICVVLAGTEARRFMFTNKCTQNVWVATQANADSQQLSETGFQLQTHEHKSVGASDKWSGRFWGRTGCDDAHRSFKCLTGDCGNSGVACNGSGYATPATLLEITLGQEMDIYHTSLVDGFNLPVSLVPVGAPRRCNTTSCTADVNSVCPKAQQIRNSKGPVIACKSGCDAFNSDKYCCRGAYASRSTCHPTDASRVFKRACPLASSYAFDDKASTFTCSRANYAITFCP